MKIIPRSEIEKILLANDFLTKIEDGFVLHSKGLSHIPPVAELAMDNGEVHIKYGYIVGGDHYVVKIASGFYQNPSLGLPSSNGLMLLFSLKTGEAVCLLQDEGLLTDYRTALAGAVAAKYLAPKEMDTIGIVGTGTQAKLNAIAISKVTGCKKVLIWGRNSQRAEQCAQEITSNGIAASTCSSITELASRTRLIVTTTPSTSPLLFKDDVQKGTLIIALGSDTEAKQELDTGLTRGARLIVDCKDQCQSRGEVSHLIKQGLIQQDDLTELGELIQKGTSPVSKDGITVVDLTGIAVQDLMIAEAIYQSACQNSKLE
jgi:ornithine cyclodeaminase